MHRGEGIRHYDQATTWVARHRGNCGREFIGVFDGGCNGLNRERVRRLLEWFEEKRSTARRRRGIEYDCRSGNGRCNLLEHFESLPDHRWRKISEAGCDATWARDTRDKMAAYRIGYTHEHDWDRARLVQQRGCGGSRIADEHVGLQADQLLGVGSCPIGACRRKAVVDTDAAAFLPAVALKYLPECREAGLYLRVVLGIPDEHPDATG